MLNNCPSEPNFPTEVNLQKSLSEKRQTNEMLLIRYNFGFCRVCQEQATGIHYGVSTCEGCKGFFKRSITKFNNYRCRAVKQCVIKAKERKKCKFCRWKMCVEVGMSISKIRMGRIPHSFKEKYLKNTPKSIFLKKFDSENKTNWCSQIELEKLVYNTDLVKNYSFSLGKNQSVDLGLLKDKCYQLYRDLVQEFEPQEKRALGVLEFGYSAKFELSHDFLTKLKTKDLILLKKHARSMIQLTNKLPGFDQISKHDLKQILSNTFFITLGIRTIKLFLQNDYFLMLDEEIQLNRELFGVLMSERVRDVVFEFFFQLKSCGLTDQEYSLLIPFILTLNHENLEQPNLLRLLGDYYLRAFFFEFSLNNRSVIFIEKLAQIMSLAPKMNKECHDIDFFMKIKEF